MRGHIGDRARFRPDRLTIQLECDPSRQPCDRGGLRDARRHPIREIPRGLRGYRRRGQQLLRRDEQIPSWVAWYSTKMQWRRELRGRRTQGRLTHDPSPPADLGRVLGRPPATRVARPANGLRISEILVRPSLVVRGCQYRRGVDVRSPLGEPRHEACRSFQGLSVRCQFPSEDPYNGRFTRASTAWR
jgi:hypothetical protein